MEDAAVAQAWRGTIRTRLLIAGVCFGVWAAAIEARLVYLQVFQHDTQVARATEQRNRTVALPGRRGVIVDRHGRTLAMSVSAETVYAVPKAIASGGRTVEQTMAVLCQALEGCGPAELETMVQRVRRTKKHLVYLKRQLTPDDTRRVLALIRREGKAKPVLTGINLLTEARRVYPNRELAAHVLGYVGTENRGLAGIEASYDSRIRGEDGELFTEIDAKGDSYNRVEKLPTAGVTVALTIDAQIQHIAERELQAAVAAHNAVGGSVIVMDPYTGAVLALANAPTFNPNAYSEAPTEARRNRSVQEIYEPGSTFKIVTASAALEEKAFALDEPIDVSAGLIRVASRTITDVHPYGQLSFADVIVKSSNVGAIKVGNRLGPERLGRYVRRFGFGERLCPDLPGESAGRLSPFGGWSAGTLASVSMGYEIGVTPMQVAAAFSAVANGGRLVQPHVVRELRMPGRRTFVEPRELRRSIDAPTVADLTAIMEQVVARGTAGAAAVPGFTAAGKTGTAAKIVNGRYSKTDYHASFAGFVPSTRPVLTVLVVIDTPRGPGYPTHHKYYGGEIAAPVFGRVAEQALRYLGVAPTVNAAPPVLIADMPVSGVVAPVSGRMGGMPAVIATGEAVVPDLRGLSARDAVGVLARLGLTVQVTGSGHVVDQWPAPGSPFEPRGSCVLRLARVAVAATGTSP